MSGNPIQLRCGLPGLEVVTFGRSGSAPLRTIAYPHRPQPDGSGGHPQRAYPSRPPRMSGPARPTIHQGLSAALGQEGDVHELSGIDFGDVAGHHHQTVRLGQRRQQVRRPTRVVTDCFHQVFATVLVPE